MWIIYSTLLLTFMSGCLHNGRRPYINDSTSVVIKQLKEVVITAEKRELSISEIPIALSVISGKNLSRPPKLIELSSIFTCRKAAKTFNPTLRPRIGTVSGTPPWIIYDGVPILIKTLYL